MAYSKKKIEQLAIEAIEKYNLVFADEVISFLPICRATFYNWNMEQLDSIKELLNERKVKTKVGLRKKWYDQGNAATEAMLYKLCGTEEERKILNNDTVSVESKNVTFNITANNDK